MTTIFKWTGWVIAFILLILLHLQRSCKRVIISPYKVYDTVTVKGDSQLVKIQDTVLKPYKVYLQPLPARVDTDLLLKNYFANRVYRDTIRARDITAVVEDSLTGDSLAGRKVLVENQRGSHIVQMSLKPVNKLFIGGFIGLAVPGFHPATGFGIDFLTKKEMLYHYGYDFVNHIHCAGISWKIGFRKD